MESHTRQRLLYAVTVRPKSFYEDVDASTGHPGYIGMRWHQQNTIGANYTDKDAAATRGICQGCALGSAHQYPTNQYYVKSPVAHDPGQQFVVDAFTHHRIYICSPLHRPRITPGISSSSLSRSSLLAWPSYFIHILDGSPMDQHLTARSRWIWKPVISQLSSQSTVTVSAIVSKPHPHVTNMLCSLILYIHAPVRTSYVHVRMCITLQDPGT